MHVLAYTSFKKCRMVQSSANKCKCVRLQSYSAKAHHISQLNALNWTEIFGAVSRVTIDITVFLLIANYNLYLSRCCYTAVQLRFYSICAHRDLVLFNTVQWHSWVAWIIQVHIGHVRHKCHRNESVIKAVHMGDVVPLWPLESNVTVMRRSIHCHVLALYLWMGTSLLHHCSNVLDRTLVSVCHGGTFVRQIETKRQIAISRSFFSSTNSACGESDLIVIIKPKEKHINWTHSHIERHFLNWCSTLGHGSSYLFVLPLFAPNLPSLAVFCRVDCSNQKLIGQDLVGTHCWSVSWVVVGRGQCNLICIGIMWCHPERCSKLWLTCKKTIEGTGAIMTDSFLPTVDR